MAPNERPDEKDTPEAPGASREELEAVRRALDEPTFWRFARERAESDRDPQARRALVEAALGALASGEPMNDDVREFVARALRDQLDDAGGRDAFAPSRDVRHPPRGIVERDLALAAAMIVQMRTMPSLGEAAAARIVIDTVGDRWGIDPDSVDGHFVDDPAIVVERAFETYGAALGKLDTATLSRMSLASPGDHA